MINFDDLLKSSLSVVNEGYQTAFDDLVDVVERLNKSIKSNAGESFALEWQSLKNEVKGSLFRIYFDTDENNPKAEAITITSIFIPSLGYPMMYGAYAFKTRIFNESGQCSNKDELEEYFSGFLASPESPLIQAIGFAMRNNGDDVDDVVPF
ncbi:hypothetical protein [Janthinobacterium lividum]|uniref:hypothetical protein n=1 Tax=Janthinobacterium lividum TaxID=29581 RepID=UPI001B812336|nr:hypothetical protein [Janthinobacterium lividum]MBR7631814.1 hypothetical protein [Janthinobacterium lividum]